MAILRIGQELAYFGLGILMILTRGDFDICAAYKEQYGIVGNSNSTLTIDGDRAYHVLTAIAKFKSGLPAKSDFGGCGTSKPPISWNAGWY